MSWIVSIFILVYIIVSFLSIIIASDYDDLFFDIKWSELEWYEKCAKVINIINISIIVLFILAVFVIAIHYMLMEIPFVRGIFTKLELG